MKIIISAGYQGENKYFSQQTWLEFGMGGTEFCIINLNLINFSINSKIKTQEFFKITKKILGSNVPKFKIDGDYLKKNGMREGESLGRALKLIEKEWINNNFEISNKRVKELIEKNFN